MVETLTEKKVRGNGDVRRVVSGKEPMPLSKVPIKKSARTKTEISELDRVLGGGLVPGQVILLAGEPGVGKSTLLIQVAGNLPSKRVLYVSGEESAEQIKIRATRLGIREKDITLLEETNVDVVVDQVDNMSQETDLGLVIIDSIQTMATSDLSGLAGSVGQIRESAYRIVRVAKAHGIPVFIVGHITKEGTVAGPAVLMHIVDTVLWFEGDKSLTYRMLRAVKNRFGPTDEVGIFSMEDKGLNSLSNPEKLFLGKSDNVPGHAVASILQGTRPVLVEIQSLVVSTKMAFPKRIAQGIDSRRYELLLAVLTRRCGLPLFDYDCYVNVAGGISIAKDPSADLAICLSTASAFYDKPLSKNTIAVGEVGLLGEVREVISQEKRIKEARRLGYNNVISHSKSPLLSYEIKSLFHTTNKE